MYNSSTFNDSLIYTKQCIYYGKEFSMEQTSKIADKQKVNMMGVDVNIADILGDKLVNQFIAQMTPEQTKALFEFVTQDLFTTKKEIDNNGDYIDKIVVKTEKRDRYGYVSRDDQSIGLYIKKRFNDRIKEELVKSVDKIIDSGEYTQTVDDIANELVEYATEGYKRDLKERIKERLVNNTVEPVIRMNGVDIRSIVHQELDSMLRR